MIYLGAMRKPTLRAREKYPVEAAAPSHGAILLQRTVAPIYLRIALKYHKVSLLGARRAIETFRDFQGGKIRLLLAFRHAYGDEPQLLGYLADNLLPSVAKKMGLPLARRPHLRFVHGYEVPLWSGALVRWLLPRIGAVPVHHEKLDSSSLTLIRRIMKDDQYPLALAPEGQVSYTSDSVPRLEAGFAKIAIWCAEDLQKEGRAERVVVLPLSIHHRYGKGAVRTLERLIRRLEAKLGITPEPGESGSPVARLRRTALGAIENAERFYGELTGRAFPKESGLSEDQRFADIIEAALEAGERALRLAPEGDVPRRFYRIRHEGWDRIFRSELGKGRPLTPLERALLDREAAEAWFAMRHMELADLGYYLHFSRLHDDLGIDKLIETAENYLDLISRLEGGTFHDRKPSMRREAVIVTGQPLDVSASINDYRQRKKETVSTLVAELDRRFAACVEEYTKEHADE